MEQQQANPEKYRVRVSSLGQGISSCLSSPDGNVLLKLVECTRYPGVLPPKAVKETCQHIPESEHS